MPLQPTLPNDGTSTRMMLFKPRPRCDVDGSHVGFTLPAPLFVLHLKLVWRSAGQPRDDQTGHVSINGINIAVICVVSTAHFCQDLVEDFALDEVFSIAHKKSFTLLPIIWFLFSVFVCPY